MPRGVPSKTIEERVAEIDKKITYHQENITKLTAKREKILNTKKTKVKTKALLELLEDKGLSFEDLISIVEPYRKKVE